MVVSGLSSPRYVCCIVPHFHGVVVGTSSLMSAMLGSMTWWHLVHHGRPGCTPPRHRLVWSSWMPGRFPP